MAQRWISPRNKISIEEQNNIFEKLNRNPSSTIHATLSHTSSSFSFAEESIIDGSFFKEPTKFKSSYMYEDEDTFQKQAQKLSQRKQRANKAREVEIKMSTTNTNQTATQSSFTLPEVNDLTDLVNGTAKSTSRAGRTASRFSPKLQQRPASTKTAPILNKIPMPDDEQEIYGSIEVFEQRIAGLQRSNKAFEQRIAELQAQNNQLVEEQSAQNARRDSATEDSRCVIEEHRNLEAELKDAKAQISAYETYFTEQTLEFQDVKAQIDEYERVCAEQTSKLEDAEIQIIQYERLFAEQTLKVKNARIQVKTYEQTFAEEMESANSQLESVCHERDEVSRNLSNITRERDEALRNCRNLTKERDELVQECRSIKKAREEVPRNLSNITRERDEAVRNFRNITEERDELVQECRNIKKARDESARKCRTITRERDEALRNYHNITTERDELLEECQTSKMARDEVAQEYHNATKERDNLASELKKRGKHAKAEHQRYDAGFQDADVTLRPSQDPKLVLAKIVSKVHLQLKQLEADVIEKTTSYLQFDKANNARKWKAAKMAMDTASAEYHALAEILYGLKDVEHSL